MSRYKAFPATILDLYCGSHIYTAHIITVQHRSPYSECRCHSNIKALLYKWSESTVEMFFWFVTIGWDRKGFSHCFYWCFAPLT